ncbi:MAG: D-alanyl-D-alanine carboxypeptidase [Clostridiales bacterium]|jgi:D-alanyl-D-alanine carboxypeptidase (penicillin-binding protein 5/6)|nr:D-alanyl-D-alanine carboxypeptidase [Clostridiales bacterium]
MKRFLIFLLLIASLLHVNSVAALNNQETSQHNQIDSIESTQNDEIDNANPDEDTEIGETPVSPVLELEAEGAVLIEQQTGKILYEKNKDKKLYPASTTKILTALLAIENGDLDEIVTVGGEANLTPKDSSLACIDLNEEITLKNLLIGLMLPSGNDAALTIGAHIGRVISGDPDMGYQEALKEFCQLMNARASELGATNSHFTNPHGYHDENHYTSAYDLALITREAMKHEVFREIIKIPRVDYPDWNEVDKNDPTKKQIRYWINKNKLLDKNNSKFYYPYATGVKTGYTSHSRNCLVSSASKDGLDVIAVVLKSTREGQYYDSIKLLDYGLNNFVVRQLLHEGQVVATTQIANHETNDPGTLRIIAKDGFQDVFHKDDIDRIEQTIEWYYTNENHQLFLKAPITKGQVVGKIIYKLDGQVIAESDLVAARDIMEKKTLVDMITPNKNNNEEPDKAENTLLDIIIHPYYLGGAAGVIILLLGIMLYLGRRKRIRRYGYYRRFR